MKKIIFLALLLSAISVKAQVGINTLSPDTSAILHIYGSGTKGLLIPEISQEVRGGSENITPANGLLAYDPVQKMYFFFNGSEWIVLNPLQATDAKKDTLKLSTGHSTMTFSSNMIIIGTVNITGSTTFQSSATFNNSITTTTTGTTTLNHPVNINSTLTTKNINASGSTVAAGTVNVTGTVTAKVLQVDTLKGYGVTPVGGIIMWSGSSIPNGWALCNGSNGTPDLRGRFIVGFSPSDSDYNSIGQQGGEKTHTLLYEEMPSHAHKMMNNIRITIGEQYKSDNIGRRVIVQDDTYGYDWTESSGLNQPHENRPPYYVLAFIMRIK